MSDNLSPQDRRKTMQAVKGKNTRLERRVSAMLAGMGLRGWQKNAADVAGKPDIVFPTQHLAIFIDGCFWHGCKTCQRKLPATNHNYWKQKINRNIVQAKRINRELRKSGWTVIRIWEHELKSSEDFGEVRQKVRLALTLENKRDDSVQPNSTRMQ